MQEIAPGVFISTAYIGATVGVVLMQRGTVYIDSPPCPDQSRAWRNTVRGMGNGTQRALVYLDHHPDRALGGRLMDCPILAHEKTAHIFRSRSAIFRAKLPQHGEAWETCPAISNVRWSQIHLSFGSELHIYWQEEEPLILQHMPGPAPGALWAILPEPKVVFVGDAVTLREPPFLALAELVPWLETLDRLISDEFQDFLVVAGRGGLAPLREIRHMRHFLLRVHEELQDLAKRKAPVEAAAELVPKLLALWEFDPAYDMLYQQRLAHGLQSCYRSSYLKVKP